MHSETIDNPGECPPHVQVDTGLAWLMSDLTPLLETAVGVPNLIGGRSRKHARVRLVHSNELKLVGSAASWRER